MFFFCRFCLENKAETAAASSNCLLRMIATTRNECFVFEARSQRIFMAAPSGFVSCVNELFFILRKKKIIGSAAHFHGNVHVLARVEAMNTC